MEKMTLTDLQKALNPLSLMPVYQWIPPTPEEVRTLIQFLGLSGGQIAREVNITGKNPGRVPRRWQSGDASIPYGAWAQLCFKAGLGVIYDESESGIDPLQQGRDAHQAGQSLGSNPHPLQSKDATAWLTGWALAAG